MYIKHELPFKLKSIQICFEVLVML